MIYANDRRMLKLNGNSSGTKAPYLFYHFFFILTAEPPYEEPSSYHFQVIFIWFLVEKWLLSATKLVMICDQ